VLFDLKASDPVVVALRSRLVCCTNLIPAVATVTAKATALLVWPATLTTTLPLVAPNGTGAMILFGDQEVGVVNTPLNETVLVPCVAPKPPPLTATDWPACPEVGLKLVMLGGTAKGTPLLLMPPTMTTTLPVVAPEGTGATTVVAVQLVGVATTPLNVT